MSTALSSWVGATIASPINLTAQKATSAVETPPLTIWKPFPDLEHLYQLSNYGEVRSIATGERVKTRFVCGQIEILSAGVRLNNRRCWPSIRKAVARAFVEKPSKSRFLVVKLIDPAGPATHASNLQWAEPVAPVYVPKPAKKAFVPEYQEPAPVSVNHSYNGYLFDHLLSEGRISQTERLKIGVATCPDDSMTPQLAEGVRFIHAMVEPAKYQTLVGKVVAVIVKAERFTFYLGRVVEITPNYVRVRRDNSQWSDRIEPRSVIQDIARVVSVLETSVN